MSLVTTKREEIFLYPLETLEAHFSVLTRKRLVPFMVMVVHLSLLRERESNCEETALDSPSKENDGKVDLGIRNKDRGKKPKGEGRRKRETEKGEQKSNREEGRESRCSFNPMTTTTAALHIIPV